MEPTFKLVSRWTTAHKPLQMGHALSPVYQAEPLRRVSKQFVTLIFCALGVEIPLLNELVQNLG
jgi:hypothetical protein